ncbi:hypothetical protein [Hymenobacter pini]|uniref:hypothetical protein n=1 Tax=Hymenobacter pini TaxID=2880879 RepID=UPI001CF2C537|nr:hypothetical protein [Hymenobacter pini]MCA8831538.1 hypothetical protein [Hymenobacter pini]
MFAPAAPRRSASHRPAPLLPFCRPVDFTTVGGELVPYAVGQAALRAGQALLVGNLLVYGTA